jgi:2-iminobutanoate/2-iminopropanoate deaminase
MMQSPAFLTIPDAPRPVAPFSHAVRVGPWLFVTGQMPTWPDDDARPLPEGIAAQTRRVMENLEIVLAGAGYGLADIVQARVYLVDFARDYAAMNAVYRGYFAADRLPARTCVGVTGLARDALVEIDLVAWRG